MDLKKLLPFYLPLRNCSPVSNQRSSFIFNWQPTISDIFLTSYSCYRRKKKSWAYIRGIMKKETHTALHCYFHVWCLTSSDIWKEVFVKEKRMLTYVVMIPCSLFFTPRMWSHKNYNCNLTPRHYNSKLRRLGNVTCNDNPVVQCSSRQSKRGENNAWRNFYTTRSFSLQSDITPCHAVPF